LFDPSAGTRFGTYAVYWIKQLRWMSEALIHSGLFLAGS
jgi:DNA-directed RNA polymerase sigma subunit (sigma70/sigma32)